MTHLLGIDAGNSKTLAMVADETGRVLGAGRAGSGSHQAVGIEQALGAIAEATQRAAAAAGVRPQEIEVAFYALAGADLKPDYAVLRPAIAARPLAPLWALDNDIVAILRSGTDAADAVAVGLGSGTNAIGRTRDGREVRFPALGWISGDWGGGGDLAEEVVRHMARAWDGRGAPSLLLEMGLTTLHVPDMETLILEIHTREIPRARLLNLVRTLFEAADVGDGVACDIVSRQAEEVIVTATTILRRLDLLGAEVDVVLGGSVFRSENRLLMDAIREGILGAAPRARIVVPPMEPAAGAVLCAMDLADISVTQAIRDRLTCTSQAALSPHPQGAAT